MSSVDQLKDMFPTVEARTIEALLIASMGAIEPATNALLYLSDPESKIKVPSKIEDAPPPPPPRPSDEEIQRRKQLKEDEELARRLAKTYERKPTKSAYKERPLIDIDDDNDEDDFVEAINKNLNDAKNFVGGWLDNVAKKFNGEDQPQQRFSATPNSSSAFNRPHYQEKESAPPQLPVRRSTNQLFSALDTSEPPKSTGIDLQDVTGENNDEEPQPTRAASTKKDKRWEALSEVAPEPTVGTSMVNAKVSLPAEATKRESFSKATTSTTIATATADDSGFVVDDSEEEEEEEEEKEEESVTKEKDLEAEEKNPERKEQDPESDAKPAI